MEMFVRLTLLATAVLVGLVVVAFVLKLVVVAAILVALVIGAAYLARTIAHRRGRVPRRWVTTLTARRF